MSLSQGYHPLSYEQQLFESHIKLKTCTSHFEPFQEPTFIGFCRRVMHHIWNESDASSLFEEVNLIFMSIFLMFGFRCHIFLKYLSSNFTSCWLIKPLLILFRCFLWIWDATATLICQLIKPRRIRILHRDKLPTPFRGRRHMVYTSIYNIDKIVEKLSNGTMSFDPDSTFIVCDNSANTHICNDRSMFTDFKELSDYSVVATIGGKHSKPSGIGFVRWIWYDDISFTKNTPSVFTCSFF